MAIAYDSPARQEQAMPPRAKHLSGSDIGLGIAAACGVAGTAAAIIGAFTVSLPVVMAAAGLMGVAVGASYLVRGNRES